MSHVILLQCHSSSDTDVVDDLFSRLSHILRQSGDLENRVSLSARGDNEGVGLDLDLFDRLSFGSNNKTHNPVWHLNPVGDAALDVGGWDALAPLGSDISEVSAGIFDFCHRKFNVILLASDHKQGRLSSTRGLDVRVRLVTQRLDLASLSSHNFRHMFWSWNCHMLCYVRGISWKRSLYVKSRQRSFSRLRISRVEIMAEIFPV